MHDCSSWPVLPLLASLFLCPNLNLSSHCADLLADGCGGGEDMNLSNLLHQHSSHIIHPTNTAHSLSTSHPRTQTGRSYFDQHRATSSHTASYPRDRDMASALTANLYTDQQPLFAQNPHHPPSPPIEDYHSKRTLPSIQSLIGVMPGSPQPDGGSQGVGKPAEPFPQCHTHTYSSCSEGGAAVISTTATSTGPVQRAPRSPFSDLRSTSCEHSQSAQAKFLNQA